MLSLALAAGALASVGFTWRVGSAEPYQEATQRRIGSLSHEVVLDALDPLLAWSWDGGVRVPATFRGERGRIDFGAAGEVEGTVLYLPLDEGAGDPLAARATGHAWTGGVFASALALCASDARLRVDGPWEAIGRESWTLEFWLRLDPDASSREVRLAELAGAVVLELDAERRVEAHFASDPPFVLRSKTVLNAGAWYRIAVTLDGPEIPLARLLVDGEVTGASTSGRAFSRPTARLELGGFTGAVDDVRLLGRSLSSGQLVRALERGARIGPHRLQLERKSGVEDLELWAGPLGPGTYAGEGLLQGALEHAWLVDGALTCTDGAWREIDPSLRPLARTTHPTLALGEQRLFVFGGETRDTHHWPMRNTDDTWIFHADRERWERLRPERAPSPRCHQMAAWSPDHQVVLLVGGLRNDREPVEIGADTWLFHAREGRWEVRHPSGDLPDQVSDCPLVYHARSRRFVLVRSGEIYLYDPDVDRWERRPTPHMRVGGAEVSARPGPSAAAAYDPESGRVLLFGGMSREGEQTTFHDHTLWYDLDENFYRWVECREAPAARVRPGFAYDSRRRRFLLFGGVRDQYSTRFDDLWSFDPRAERWTRHAASNPPGRRGGYYGMAYDAELDRAFLLCGREAPTRFLDESWSLHVDPGTAGTARWVFDRSSMASEGEWCARVDTPGDARIELDYASSMDGRSWHASEGSGPISGESFLRVDARLTRGSNGELPRIQAIGLGVEEIEGPGRLLRRALEPLR
jgi:hypothetical protein